MYEAKPAHHLRAPPDVSIARSSALLPTCFCLPAIPVYPWWSRLQLHALCRSAVPRTCYASQEYAPLLANEATKYKMGTQLPCISLHTDGMCQAYNFLLARVKPASKLTVIARCRRAERWQCTARLQISTGSLYERKIRLLATATTISNYRADPLELNEHATGTACMQQ